MWRTLRAEKWIGMDSKKTKEGTLIIIGGQEDKVGDKSILKEIVKHNGSGHLVVATIASQIPAEVWDGYKEVFHKLGVKKVSHFNIEQPDEAHQLQALEVFKDAKTVFFTGGDQLKITTKIGGSVVLRRIQEIFQKGGTIAGTSAGAAVMGQTMLVGGENTESHKVGNWMMAPGLGFMNEIIIDQHFAQRGRIGRLLGAVSMNPGVLGVGIDEDTSIIVKKDSFEVVGSNAIYVIDGRDVTYTNVAEASADKTMSMHNVKLHILTDGETYDLVKRLPGIFKLPKKNSSRSSVSH
jgi:cyanophycinase